MGPAWAGDSRPRRRGPVRAGADAFQAFSRTRNLSFTNTRPHIAHHTHAHARGFYQSCETGRPAAL